MGAEKRSQYRFWSGAYACTVYLLCLTALPYGVAKGDTPLPKRARQYVSDYRKLKKGDYIAKGIIVTHLLNLPFQTIGGRLVVAGEEIIRPMEAGESLYFVTNSGNQTIRLLNELKGKVIIKTPRAALAYALLVASKPTNLLYCLPESTKDKTRIYAYPVEITPKRANDMHEEGSDGVVSPRYLKEMGIKPAVCKSVEGGFEVNRTWLVDRIEKEKSVLEIWLVTERVAKNGSYEIARRVLNIRTPPQVQWAIEYIE